MKTSHEHDRTDREIDRDHERGFQTADAVERESGIHNLVGFHWSLFDGSISGCDTAWALAYLNHNSYHRAMKSLMRLIAGQRKEYYGARLLTNVTDEQRERAASWLAAN